MQGYLKEIRVPATALVALVVASIMVLVQRHDLRRATETVEQYLVADVLLGLPEAKLQFQRAVGAGLRDDNNQGASPSDLQREIEMVNAIYQRAQKDFGAMGAIETLGQLSEEYPNDCTARLRIPFGGWLNITTAAANDDHFKRVRQGMQSAEEEWGKATNDDETKAKAPAAQKPKRGSAKGPRSQSSDIPTAQSPVRKVFFLRVVTGEGSDLVGKAETFVFTNEKTEELPGDWTVTHSVPGELGVLLPTLKAGEWREPLNREAIVAAGIREARKLGATDMELPQAYLTVRGMYERQEIKLPFVDATVSAGSFLFFAVGLAIALAAWASFLLRALRRGVPKAEDEPWIIVEPFRRLHQTNGWDRWVASVEAILFASFHAVAFTAPATLATTAIVIYRSDHLLLSVPLLILSLLLSASMVHSYWLVLRRVTRGARLPRQPSEPFATHSA